MTKTFTVLDSSGAIIFKSRGKIGAAQKAINALYDYREAVKAASGMLYGRPQSMGSIEADGVRVTTLGGYYLAEDMAG